MKYCVSWLNELAHTHLSAEEMAELFTRHSFEVDGIEKIKSAPSGVVVGKILDISLHPNADKLQCTKVTIDPQEKEILTIVCGAKNITVGDIVPVATVGTKLEEDCLITKSTIRGELSEGMLCAEDELGLGKDHSGILQLDKEIPIGTSLVEVFGQGDEVIELDILASRGRDALSHIGIARELSAITGGENLGENRGENTPPSLSGEKENKESEKIHINIESKKLSKRYMGVLLKSVNNTAQTPDWMMRRLRACGVHSINIATDITNYVMLETGQPLHAFDAKKIGDVSQKISLQIRKGRKGERLSLLDGKEVEVNENDIVIANDQEVLALAGVMGGKTSGTSKETSSVFLESAWFDPISIRKTRMRHKIITESSYRFERDIDPEGVSLAVARAIELFKKYAGAHIEEEKDLYLEKEKSVAVILPYYEIQSLLGVSIPLEKVVSILKLLSFKVRQDGEILSVYVPSFRKDIRTFQDIIEEVGRLYGYDHIQPQALITPLRASRENSSHKIVRLMGNALTGCGFDEIMTYSFYGDETVKLFGLEKESHFTLLNPLSPDQKYFRSKILPNMLKAVPANIKRFENINIFEIGKVYEREDDGSVKEYQRLGIISSQAKKEKKGETLLRLKGTIESILFSLFGQYPDVSPIEFEKGLEYFHRSQSMDVSLDGVLIGFVGTLHPSITKKMKLPEQTAVASLDRDALAFLFERESRYYTPLERFPSVFRDISMKVPYEITAKEVEDAIREIIDKEHLQSLELFDVFEKEEEKNFAYHLEFNSRQRTLTGKEIDDSMERVFEKLDSLGIEIRK